MSSSEASFDFNSIPQFGSTLNAIWPIVFILGLVSTKNGRGTIRQRIIVAGLIASTVVIACFLAFRVSLPTTQPDRGIEQQSVNNGAQTMDPKSSVQRNHLIFSPKLREVVADPGLGSVEAKFLVSNTGSEFVRIESMESTCACLSVTVDQNPIPPASHARITGLFDISKLKGTSDKLIKVNLVDDKHPVELTARITIKEIYTIETDLTQWSVGDEPVTKTVEFRVLRDQPIHVLSTESNREEMKCELIELEPGRAYDLRLTPKSTRQTMLGIVRLETDCEIEAYARPLAYFMIQ